MQLASPKTKTIRPSHISKTIYQGDDIWRSHRYPFVAADILSSSAKLADAFIEIKKVEVSSPTKESKETTSPGAVMPALVDQQDEEAAK